ncbi:MAG TPA: LLM class flavin-dependent oxidoreductase [Candidatus Tectomicrobia bacterium]|nr:LLM class flavin-dependent oxidoreductase [Candidatus Tectomicrobia bacterium]
MGTLAFGIFDSFGPFEMAEFPTVVDVYEEHIRQAQEAEQLGYRYYFFIEHQNSPVCSVTAPNVYLTALASRTSMLRFGLMIYQLPFHHPVRLAQELATLDQISRGRLEFGTGTGVLEHEFMRWNLPFNERHEMSAEALKIIVKAWTEDTLTYQGKYWQFDEALPTPKPYQQPHPPIWVAAHSAPSFDYAAQHNYHIAQNIDVDTVIAEKFAYYRQLWKQYGHPGPMPQAFLTRHVHVAETDAQARAEAEPHLLMGYIQGGELIAKTRVGFGPNGRESTERGTPERQELRRVFEECTKSYDFWVDNGLALVGSPDTVIRKIEAQQKLTGYDIFGARHRIGHLDPALAQKSMRLFAKYVIPAFA